MGWRPRMPLDDGLAETVDFYRSRLAELPPLAHPDTRSKPDT